jgi:hypothetical protein
MKKLLGIVILFLISSAAAQVSYDIEAGENSVEMNSTIVLECDTQDENCPVNSWQVSWDIPENAEVVSLEDSQGVIEDYSIDRDTLSFQTNTGPRRSSERIDIELYIEEDAEKFGDLYRREVSLPGFQGKSNQGTLQVENLLSATISSDFGKSFGEKRVNFSGSGASNVQINFGEGEEVGEYVFFGDRVDNSSLAYRIAVGTTGRTQDFPKIPVRVLPDEEYDQKVSEWSGGEYTSGLIRIRQNPEENQAAVLAEETVHSFNDAAFSFDKTSSSWLDEGIAGYTQAMVRKKMLGRDKTREVFGKDTSYRETREEGIYRVTKPSKGDKEELWEYYQEDRDFMKGWSPEDSSRRDFGYAYSELIVRNWVSQNNSVRGIYGEIGDQELNSNDEKWEYYSDFMDLTPCKSESRERFDRCLERINSYDYPVLAAEEIPYRDQSTIKVQELDIPENERYRNRELFEEGAASSALDRLAGIFKTLQNWISSNL